MASILVCANPKCRKRWASFHCHRHCDNPECPWWTCRACHHDNGANAGGQPSAIPHRKL